MGSPTVLPLATSLCKERALKNVWTTSRGSFTPALTITTNYSNHDCGFSGGPVKITMQHTVPNSPNIPAQNGKIWLLAVLLVVAFYNSLLTNSVIN